VLGGKAGTQLQELGNDVRGGAGPDARIVQQIGLGLGGGDHGGQRLERPVGRNHHHIRQIGDRRDADQVAHGVEGQVGLNERRDRIRGRREQDGVAVRIGPCHRGGCGGAAGAEAAFDDRGLTDLSADLFEHRAGDGVRRAARGEGHNDMDGFRRPGLRQHAPVTGVATEPE
jgi:hypothetical protein